jgi:hypothetical protein
VSYVLRMPALQVGHPVLFFVQVKPGNAPLHQRWSAPSMRVAAGAPRTKPM